MRNYNVARLERGRELPAHLQERLVIRDKKFDQIAHLCDFRRRTDEIWNGPRRSIPHENMKPFFTQNIRDAASDYAEPNYADVSPCPTRHYQKVQANRVPSNGEVESIMSTYTR